LHPSCSYEEEKFPILAVMRDTILSVETNTIVQTEGKKTPQQKSVTKTSAL
jgi:hypothetical protein